MNNKRIRSVVVGLGLLLPVAAMMGGCGDLCDAEQACGMMPQQDDSASDSGDAADSGDDMDDGSSGELEPDPTMLVFVDNDGDGFGDPDQSMTIEGDELTDGYVLDSSDCDDDDEHTFPGAAMADSGTACMNDDDGDGFGDMDVPDGVTAGTDCDDDSASTFPGSAHNEAPALCTNDDDGDGWGDADPGPGVDPGNDCSDTDPKLYGCTIVWCLDSDGDGYGDGARCMGGGGEAPPMHVGNGDDCRDDDAQIHPGAASSEPDLCTVDADADGYGSRTPPEGAEAGSDCDDAAAYTYPGAAGYEPAPLDEACTKDEDGDGYGDWGTTGPVVAGNDCDDTSAFTYPGAAELEHATACMADEDGDGYGQSAPLAGVAPGTDCHDDDVAITQCGSWCLDSDGDGFGGAGGCVVADSAPSPDYVQNNTDCYDADALTYPGAGSNEAPPLDTACLMDADGDGYGEDTPPKGVWAGTDCADDEAYTHPGAAPMDSPVGCMTDADGDGFGSSLAPAGGMAGSDCDDGDDGVLACAQWCVDGDGDGYGSGPCVEAGAAPAPGWVTNSEDCVDTDADTYPGAAEAEPSLCTRDLDGDGWGATLLSGFAPGGADSGHDCDDTNPAVIWGCDEV